MGGAYGIDIGTNVVELLLQLSDAMPRNVMIRTGMTNPPYIAHRSNVHAFMHIPVQSGSDNVLNSMRREYTVAEFSHLVDRLKAAVPDISILTDIICGFPTESEDDWQRQWRCAGSITFMAFTFLSFMLGLAHPLRS